jgi:V8-like Glu-specific endopeptidase
MFFGIQLWGSNSFLSARTKFFILIMLLSPAAGVPLFAQLSQGGSPYSFSHQVKSELPEVATAVVDKPRLLREDAAEAGKGLPFRFGIANEVSLSPRESGVWETLPDGSKLWRLKIICPGASSVNLVYSDFWLPAGSTLFLYNDARTEVLGAFTERNNKPDGFFATGLIRGESLTLEYLEPARVSAPGRIGIRYIIHGYKDIFKEYPLWEKRDYGTSGSCEVNINCTQGAEWQTEKRAVAMVLTSNATRICSGALVNNVRQDLTPYFLTANHCVSGETPNTWIFMFNYESPGCTTVDGPLNYTLNGSTLLAQSDSSDFALLQLTETPPDTFRVHWAGWNAGTNTPTSGATIHHPDGDIKKISLTTASFTDTSWTGTPANSHWRVFWKTGVTEPGSSGSPLFDQDHHIVGQLHGGPSSCTGSDKSDLFGKFSMSWNYGATSASRLKDWLDPDNTGKLVMNGWDPTLGVHDTIPPTRITDFRVLAKTSNTLTVGWSAPLDSSHGGVVKYDLRYAKFAITDTTSFLNGTPAAITSSPKSPGQPEQVTIAGLPFATKFYIAIRSADMWGNVSRISNVIVDSTYAAPVAQVFPAAINDSLIAGLSKLDSVVIRNTTSFPSTLTYAVSFENNTFPPSSVSAKLIPLRNVLEKSMSTRQAIEPVGQSITAHGGPDQFGYQWIDSDDANGPVYQWNDISTTGTPVTSWIATGNYPGSDEGYAGPFPIGFSFPFYGSVKSQVYIAADGMLLFSPATTNLYSNLSLPCTIPNEFIAPFWDDLDGSTQGAVYYKTDADKFIVQYTNWQRYPKTGSLTFQVVLYASGKITFYYNNMNATLNSATVGIENAGGTIGLQMAYNADYVKNNLAVQLVPQPDWYSGLNLSGTLGNQNASAVGLMLHTQNIPIGNYSVDMKIASNDPVNPVIVIPVKLKVLTPTAPLIVIAPHGGEKWPAGSRQQIIWTKIAISSVLLHYSTNAGKDWLAINDTPQIGNSYTWTIPNTQSTSCLVRIKNAAADSVFDMSDSLFSITAPNSVKEPLIPHQYALEQNYPNPFNPTTTISYSLAASGTVSLRLYDALGREVAVLVNGQKTPGRYSVSFNAANLPSGVYFYTMHAGSFMSSRKLLLLK